MPFTRKVRVLFKTRLIFLGINGPNMFLVGMSIYHLQKNVLPNSWFWMHKRILTFEILIPKMSVQGAIELYIRCIKVSKVLVLK